MPLATGYFVQAVYGKAAPGRGDESVDEGKEM